MLPTKNLDLPSTSTASLDETVDLVRLARSLSDFGDEGVGVESSLEPGWKTSVGHGMGGGRR
jgi:hypothetical protein